MGSGHTRFSDLAFEDPALACVMLAEAKPAPAGPPSALAGTGKPVSI